MLEIGDNPHWWEQSRCPNIIHNWRVTHIITITDIDDKIAIRMTMSTDTPCAWRMLLELRDGGLRRMFRNMRPNYLFGKKSEHHQDDHFFTHQGWCRLLQRQLKIHLLWSSFCDQGVNNAWRACRVPEVGYSRQRCPQMAVKTRYISLYGTLPR